MTQKRQRRRVLRLPANILNRVVGKAPPVDVTELRHTEIVYRSAEEIRKALIERGVPPAWLDLTVDEEDEQTTPITREQIRDRAKIEFDKAGKNF
jgi:hypothetical protein